MAGEHDAFEAAEMHDGARVVRRDKVVSRSMAVMLAAPSLFTIAIAVYIAFANASASKPVPPEALPLVVGGMVALGLLLATLGIVFGVLRTVVTEHAVHVRYGLWGPTIPIPSIRACRVVDYEWTKFGGWGIKRARDGTWAYVATSAGKVLELTYEEEGRERRVQIGVSDAAETARQIERLRNAALEGIPSAARADDRAAAAESDPADDEKMGGRARR
ncbi:MAG TPA: hypothetical protein VF765_08500 [Polyangiaceae bacterium]